MSNEHRIYPTSLEYVFADVISPSYDPTGDVVQMAFIPLDQVEPGSGDWVFGGWRTIGSGITTQYAAKCLVGPGGVVQLAPGLYQVFVKVEDVPEIPVKQAETLLRVA